MNRKKCVIILSEKSSGSSACLRFLAQQTTLRSVEYTRHYENETLYWVKAASVLGRPQQDMIDSEVPLPEPQARRELREMVVRNAPDFDLPDSDYALVHAGWRALVEAHSPCFLEKSPHHLCQWSALELIADNIRLNPDIDFLLVGLIRNPMDTLYSQFDRWRHTPGDTEKQWRIAYENLRRLPDLVGQERVVQLRYEDMVRDPRRYLRPVFDFCGADEPMMEESGFHVRSLQRWRNKSWFGFVLSEDTLALAESWGYRREDMHNHPKFLWPLIGWGLRLQYRLIKPFKNLYRWYRYPEKRLVSLGN